MDGPKRLCLACVAREVRAFQRTCVDCGAGFTDQNNRREYCNTCDAKHHPGVCCGCGAAVGKRNQRCNSCEATRRGQDPDRPPRGCRRYEHNGVRYRSKWEVEFASILEGAGVEFQYERFDPETRTRPDFYITALDRYVEIHPDVHGPKKLPSNAVMVKTREHARAMAFSIALKVNRPGLDAFMRSQSVRSVRGMYKSTLSLLVYMGTAIVTGEYPPDRRQSMGGGR